MTFFQFARNNVTRNGRAYVAYFLSSTFAILLFFLYATLINHPDLQKGYVNHFVINGMQIAQGIICMRWDHFCAGATRNLACLPFWVSQMGSCCG